MIYMTILPSLEVAVIVIKKYTLLFLFLLEKPSPKFEYKLIPQIKNSMLEIWQFVKDQMVLVLEILFLSHLVEIMMSEYLE